MTRTLSTSEFARALGLSDSSVRRLTDSGEIQVHRTRGGHRRILVSEAIQYIRRTDALVVQPEILGLEGIAQLNDARATSGSIEAESVGQRMLRVLEAGHAQAVIGLMQMLYASGMSIAELCDGPIAFALGSIGARWPHDKRAIFIEHRATILCGRALNQLRLSIPAADEGAPKAIGGAMSGDIYLLPTLMASLVLYDCGFDETNLGPNTPLDVLADAVIDERPNLIWLSISEPFRSHSQLSEILKLAEVARQNQTGFIVGGRCAGELVSLQEDQTGTRRWVNCDSMVALSRMALDSTKIN